MALHLIPSPALAPLHCSYSEAAYFDGYAFQHIADWRDSIARERPHIKESA